MSRYRSLTNLILDVRQRTNMESSAFVTDLEITEYLNQGLAELHGHLTANEGQPHFRTAYQIAVTQGISLYALPSDFWKVLRVTAVLDGYTVDLEPFMEGERAALLNSSIYGYIARGFSPMYRVQAGNLEILPSTRAYSATLYYVQAPLRLVQGSDTVDGYGGYELVAIYDACATILQKEESDPSFYLAQKERILKHVDAQAAQRDTSHPERVTDVTGGLDMLSMPWLWQ